MKTIGIAASGPSLTREDCTTLIDVCDTTIAVNDTYRMGDFSHLYAADSRWWKHHIGTVAVDFEGRCWSCEPKGDTNWGKDSEADAWGITVMRCHVGGTGLSKDPGEVVGGQNSGYQAINLALHLGADRIILIGYDMTWTGGKSHWFGDHPEELNNAKPDKYAANFKTIKPKDYGIEIINCSRFTHLDAFPVHNLDDIQGLT